MTVCIPSHSIGHCLIVLPRWSAGHGRWSTTIYMLLDTDDIGMPLPMPPGVGADVASVASCCVGSGIHYSPFCACENKST